MIRPTLMLAAAALTACGGTSAEQVPPELPVLTGRVVDNADLLSPDQETLLARLLETTESRTRHQFVVVTLPSLNGKPIEAVGLELDRGWRIGRRGHDDGVLLIVAPNERRVGIEVGYGLEKALTDEEAGAIIQQRILPRFRRGAMAAGVLDGSAGIIREIDTPGTTP